MEINQVKSAMREMEEEIFKAVTKSIETFHEKTGLYPNGIDLSFIREQIIGEHAAKLKVRDVMVEVRL